MNGLDEAIKHFGGQSILAKALGVSSMAISQWKKRGVPASRAVEIETATNGGVPRHLIRPDLFGLPKKNKAAA